MSENIETNTSNAKGSTMPELTPEEGQMYALFKQFLEIATGQKEVKATGDQWAQMMSSDHIKTIGPKLKAQTKATKLQEDFENLLGSAKSGRILEGKIIGVRSVNKDKDIATYVAEVQYGNDSVSVLIPSYELYDYDLKKYRDAGEEERIHNHMCNMIGADVSFIVRQVNKSTKTAYASRLAAMEKIARDNYRKHDSKTEKPRINVGDVIEARVVYIREHEIAVEAFGIDCMIPATKADNRLSWEYISDCHEHFRPNDVIPVKVLDITPKIVERNGMEYKMFSVKVSYKDTQENPIETYWDVVEEGELGSAVITAIMNGSTFCRYKNRFIIMCAYPEIGEAPYVGQKRIVKITSKKIDPDGTKRIFGVYVGV